MKGLELKLHIILYATVMILIIIALFYSFSKTESVNKNLRVKRTAGNEISMKSTSYVELKSKEKEKINTSEIGSIRYEFEKIDNDFDKIYVSNLFAIGLRWCYSILFLITMLSILSQHVRGWLFSVALSELQLLSVLFIELKDGKKDSLVFHYSI